MDMERNVLLGVIFVCLVIIVLPLSGWRENFRKNLTTMAIFVPLFAICLLGFAMFTDAMAKAREENAPAHRITSSDGESWISKGVITYSGGRRGGTKCVSFKDALNGKGVTVCGNFTDVTL